MAGFERKWSLEREEKHYFLDKRGLRESLLVAKGDKEGEDGHVICHVLTVT